MLDHVGFTVSNFAKSLAFYRAALAPLDVTVLMQLSKDQTGGFEGAGLGRDGKPSLWLSGGEETTPPLHIAIAARTRAEVDAFHTAAMAAGATDNGAPGIREHYHPNYYGAFVLDPDGHNLEAVCHAPE